MWPTAFERDRMEPEQLMGLARLGCSLSAFDKTRLDGSQLLELHSLRQTLSHLDRTRLSNSELLELVRRGETLTRLELARLNPTELTRIYTVPNNVTANTLQSEELSEATHAHRAPDSNRELNDVSPVDIRIKTPSINAPAGEADLGSSYRYDALISYRRQEPDRNFARALVKRLDSSRLRIAIDERDFDPAASFLEEMERCVIQSRFTLAVASPRYFESGNCIEEAIICKVLDMSERRRRTIPLIIESVTMPTWLYNIVGIDFTDSDPLVDPHDKLITKLRSP